MIGRARLTRPNHPLGLAAAASLLGLLLLAFPAASRADPPVFTSIPADMLVVAENSEGAYVDYPLPTATDDNGPPDVGCDPAPNDLFPVGETTVNCTATDLDTNEQSTASFKVRVLAEPQEEASSGSVQALFYYTETTDSYGLTVFKNLRLTILRQGKIAFSAAVPRYPGSKNPVYPAGYGDSPALFVRDLDGDSEPEVRLDLFWGGAHCCFWTDVYRYTGSGYSLAHHFWGDLSYRLADLNHDGRPEFVSADDRFAYAFSAFAYSYFPIRIWSYKAGRFSNVTRRYPGKIRADAARTWRAYGRMRRAHYETEGALAAWAADQYLLRRRTLVWKRLGALARGGALTGDYKPKVYLRRLKRFLARLGYAR